MSIDLTANAIVNGLVVAGLVGLARTTLSTARALGILSSRVDEHDRRLGNRDLDDRQDRRK